MTNFALTIETRFPSSMLVIKVMISIWVNYKFLRMFLKSKAWDISLLEILFISLLQCFTAQGLRFRLYVEFKFQNFNNKKLELSNIAREIQLNQISFGIKTQTPIDIVIYIKCQSIPLFKQKTYPII
jgi:hypothetical protein